MSAAHASMLCLVLLALQLLSNTVTAQLTPVRSSSPSTLERRDAFSDQDKISNEGEDHNPPTIPSGANLVSLPVTDSASVAVYWTAKPQNSTATNAYIMMHGKLRDGANYWTILNNVLKSAIAANTPNAVSTSIITAPQFYSTKFNSGEYKPNEIAFADTNVWQAAEAASHPANTNVTSFERARCAPRRVQRRLQVPHHEAITFVGHGGGAQLISRYAMAGAGLPSSSPIHLRYVVGDPSSNPYFTLDRPLQDPSVANKSTCPSTTVGDTASTDSTAPNPADLLTPQQYFTRLATRDVRWVVGIKTPNPTATTPAWPNSKGRCTTRSKPLLVALHQHARRY